MSYNSILTRIIEIGFDVQKLFQKILESSNENLSQIMKLFKGKIKKSIF